MFLCELFILRIFPTRDVKQNTVIYNDLKEFFCSCATTYVFVFNFYKMFTYLLFSMCNSLQDPKSKL